MKMGRRSTDKEQHDFLEQLRYGRDEMNLLEHSISSAGTKVDRETRSLVFRRSDIKPDTKQPIERTWEVSFSKHGRPTAIDDDVFVALLKISHDMGFTDKRVEFTRYELCKILSWADNGQNYRKIDDALRRITGVYIVATNFWYDNRDKGWRDRNFHVLDSSEVFNRERLDQERKASGGRTPRSWFQWSDTMMESFAAGYLRKLDLRECLSLENPVARKLYRYLGMQFYRRTTLCLDLGVLCCEKLGYRRGTELNELRRKVLPAISELERRGIYGLSHEFKASYGKCDVVFSAKPPAKAGVNRKPTLNNSATPLIERLVKLGIDRKDAEIATRAHTPERIIADIEHVEFEERAGRVKTSKAGLLATMLKASTPWPRPKGFTSTPSRIAKAAAEKTVRELQVQESQAKRARERQENQESELQFEAFLKGLSDAERRKFQNQALKNPFFATRYEDAVSQDNPAKVAQWLHAALYRAWKNRSGDLLLSPQRASSSDTRE